MHGPWQRLMWNRRQGRAKARLPRSEEHTSELQSQSNLVCRLLLEKKNLKAIGNFDFDRDSGKLSDVPPQYRALDGQKVLLMGEIYAPHEAGPNVTDVELG